MTLTVEGMNDPPGLRLTGALDMSTVHVVEEGFRRLELTDGPFTVDLEGVTFVDSTGLLALMKLARQLGPERDLVVLNPSTQVRRVFALTGLDRRPGVRVVNDRQ